jgi:hypothetical protein
MTRRRVAIIAGGCTLLLAALTFKVEHIEEVCSLTGASKRYNRYFSIVTTPPQIRESWIGETLKDAGRPVDERNWVRTMGDTWTLSSFHRSHARAPVTYGVRLFTVPMLRETFTSEAVLQLAEDFVSGDPSRQDAALERIMNPEEKGEPTDPSNHSPRVTPAADAPVAPRSDGDDPER